MKGPESQDDAVEGEGFGERGGGEDGVEGAEGGEPEGVEGGAGVPDAAGEVGEEETGEELEGDLEPGYGVVVSDAEDGEAGGQEERVAGEANERGMEDSAAVNERELVVLEDGGCDVAVDEGVAAGLGEGAHHPEAEDEAAGEGGENADEGVCAYTGERRGDVIGMRRIWLFLVGLTHFPAFPTIRV